MIICDTAMQKNLQKCPPLKSAILRVVHSDIFFLLDDDVLCLYLMCSRWNHQKIPKITLLWQYYAQSVWNCTNMMIHMQILSKTYDMLH